MAQVVFSYAKEDRCTALPIIDAFTQAGLEVWHTDLRSPEVMIEEQMRRELQTSQCVVVLWSKAAALSNFVQREVQHAIQAWSSGGLVLAALDDAPMPVGLRDLPVISLQRPSDSGILQLIERARAIIARQLTRTAVETETVVYSPITPSPSKTNAARFRSSSAFRLTTRVVIGAAVGILGIISITALLFKPSEHPSGPEATITASASRQEAALPLVASETLKDIEKALQETRKMLEELKAEEEDKLGRGKIDATERMIAPATNSGSNANQTSTNPRQWSFELTSVPFSAGILSLPLLQVALVLVAAIGAAAVWVWAAWSRRRLNRPLSAMAMPREIAPIAASNGAPQVFVSYSHKDGLAVDELVKQFEQLGYAVWIDRQSTGAQRYAAPVVHAIRMSRLVALMTSRNAFASDHVIREVYVAGDYKKPFIVFQLDPTEFPDDVLYFVSGFPRIPIASANPQQLRTEIARLIAA